jgi:uncharacterized Zn-finger protein
MILCDYSSYKRSDLERNSKGVHLAIKDFKCDICDQAFSRKGHLNDHVNSVHMNLTRHSCDLCDYSSYKRSDLERHSKGVHLAIKDFKCDICDQAFSEIFFSIFNQFFFHSYKSCPQLRRVTNKNVNAVAYWEHSIWPFSKKN